MRNFDFAFPFADVVVDEKWTVGQFSDLCPLPDQPAHARKTSQQFDVLD
jgi:hypothetical protein